MIDSILIVCTGNICRSPIAERIFCTLLPGKIVGSAGTMQPWKSSADTRAIRIAEKNNVSLASHVSRQFTTDIAAHYDLILAMEKTHITQITSIAPEARSKSLLLGHWLDQMEIPDPRHKSDEAFEFVYQLINLSCLSWISKLSE